VSLVAINPCNANTLTLLAAVSAGMLLDSGFEEEHSSFCRQHCHEFEVRFSGCRPLTRQALEGCILHP
jgi:hypothetical protein